MARAIDTMNIRKRVIWRNGRREFHYQVRLQVRDHLGKLRKFVETFENVADAIRWRDIMRGQGRLGDIGERDALSRAIQNVTLGEALARYQETPQFKRRALLHKANGKGSDEAGMIAAFAKKEATGLCTKLVVDLNSTDFQEHIERRLADGVKAATVKRDLNPIRVMFRYSAKHWQYPPKGYLFEGLFDDHKDELNAHRERTLKPDERFKLYRAIERLRSKKHRRMWLALVVTALSTGMRRGELLQLEWRDIDLFDGTATAGRDTICVRREIAKNRKARLLPLSRETSCHLDWYRDELEEVAKAPNAKVFPITAGAHEQAWRRICKHAEIDHRDLHFHDLRHTATTNFVQKPIALTVPELNWVLKGKLFDDRVLSIYANPEVRDVVESIRTKLDAAEDVFDAAHADGEEHIAGKQGDLTVEQIANLRLRHASKPWLDRWDWIERDGKVIIDRGGPRTQETLSRLGGRMPFGGDEAIDEYFQFCEREMAKVSEVGTKDLIRPIAR
jgi:integrase